MGRTKTIKDTMGEYAEVKGKDKAAIVENESTMLNTRISKRTLKALKVFVAVNETTIQAFVSEVVERELKARGGL